MNREQLEHFIRSASALLGDDGVIIIGSQAILGAHPDDLPRAAMMSPEIDILPMRDPTGEKADLISGNLGEFSKFHDEFEVYAEGVGLGTARLPKGWEDRLIEVSSPNTNEYTGWCLDPHDLCASKLIAGRDKDFTYLEAVLQSGHIDRIALVQRVLELDATDEEKERCLRSIKRMAPPGRKGPYRGALRLAMESVRPKAKLTPSSRLPAQPKTRDATCGRTVASTGRSCLLRPGHRGHCRSVIPGRR